jgi:hypothetical protein
MILALHKNKQSKHDRSIFGRERMRRSRVDGHNRLVLSYFAESLMYLRHRFRMRTGLFKHNAESVKLYDTFEQRMSNVRELGQRTYQKMTATLREMIYRISADLVEAKRTPPKCDLPKGLHHYF